MPLRDPVGKHRVQLGLEPVPPTVQRDPQALEEVRRIGELVGTKERLRLEE
ncbi:MAG: hypothetical protein GXO65_02480 [Euryarchaeota archaeon]|nr:hypothetical protein [Euryarchaeota archaeon]